MKITIVGLGYVGLANAALFCRQHEVALLDINHRVVDSFNKKTLSINEKQLASALYGSKNVYATFDENDAYNCADIVIIATSTDLRSDSISLSTTSVVDVLSGIAKKNRRALVVIRSTVSVGFTEWAKKEFGLDIIFCPEFLREGHSLEDSFNPDRVIIGIPHYNTSLKERALYFASLITDQIGLDFSLVKVMGSSEAESVKLFANAYLAMRVSFFNELDTFAENKGLNTKDIIDGICLDRRIGNRYNNPSFGYGGYCLPKDSKHLLYEFRNISSTIINAVVDSNEIRKHYIASRVLSFNPQIIGIYRLIMKSDSDNFRESSTLGIMNYLKREGVKLLVYEPFLESGVYDDYEVINDLNQFAEMSDIIVANRYEDELKPFENKIYTRDVFRMN